MTNEAYARIQIDKLLEAAQWDVLNEAQVSTEEPNRDGRADYLLKNTRTQPLAVLEAKRFSLDPYSAKTQAKAYAESLGAPFVILSNGQEHYFWDYRDGGDARPILGFPTQADLERRANLKLHRQESLEATLAKIPYPEQFRYKGEEISPYNYQLRCLERVDRALIAGRRRMLLEMATGTGKTLTIAMIMKRWFQSAIVSRVLFLVDRIELATQARDTFEDYLKDYPCTVLYGGKRSLEGQIVVGTLDTIAGQLGGRGFGHGYFDLVVTDECHRSIYNTHRATLAHFDAIHIGLTATPNPGELRSVSEHERQLIKNTYIYFDCWDTAKKEGKPTFSYTIQEGINEGHLAKYQIYVAESKLTFEGAEWEGEEIAPGRWGRDTESEDRLKLIIQEYFNVEEERSQTHSRKTIVFAVGERQAVILARLFNQLLPDEACLRIAKQLNCSASQVRQGFAKTITSYSNNGNVKPLIQEFKYDPLPIMAVSVDILDTGYDHKEIENLVMIRPTKSAIKYAQMRGRGSRLCPRIGKTEFLIYDFAGNTERFDDPGQEYHRPKVIAPRFQRSKSDNLDEFDLVPEPPPESREKREFVLIPQGSLEDEIRHRELIVVGPEGLEIDQKQYRDKWNETVVELKQTDPAIQKIFAGEELTEQEWETLKWRLDSPSFYFSEQTLQRAFDQPTGSLSDFIRSALGLYQFPTREERIEQIFRAWVTEHSASLKPEQAKMLNLLKQRVLAREKVEMRLFSQPPFSLLGGRVRMEQLFGKEELTRIVEELNTLLVA